MPLAEDLEKISAKLNIKEDVKASGEGAESPTSSVRVFSGELTDTGRENLTKTKKALRALNKRGGADVSLIITEDIPGTNGVMVGDRMYITRAALESGKYIGTLVHEYTHFAEGTPDYNRLWKFYASDGTAFAQAIQNVIDSGYGITDSDVKNIFAKLDKGEKLTEQETEIYAKLISEVNAKMSEAILGNEQFINKLVREDASLAAKIIDKIKSLIEMLKNIGNSAAMAEYRRLKEAEKLYLKAAEAAGNRQLIAKIFEKKAEDEKEKVAEAQETSEDVTPEQASTDNLTEDANTDQNDKKTPLTSINNENMHVSDNDIAPRITVGMSEDERAKILQHLTLQPQEIIIPEKFDIDFEQLERSRKSEISSTLIQKLRDLGCLKAYQTSSVDVQFEFTGGGLRKSMNSQVYDYGGTLGDLAKVILNMQTLLDNAVLLEIHSDKAVGTEQENKQLKNTYVLLSAFAEGENITPVQFEIKQYVDENNRLYLAVALTKIETSVVGDTISDKNQTSTRLLPVSDISLPHLIEKINPRDENFFKYIPNSFLNNEQLAAKERAFVKERKKYGKEEIQFSREVSDVNPANARKKNPSIADIERRKAEFEKLRVYEKTDAEIIINNILSSVLPADENVFSQLENKTRKQAENILYDTLNRASTDAEKTKAASDLRVY